MKANQIITTLAELVSQIERLYPTEYGSRFDDGYAKGKTAALVHAAQELERLSEAEQRAFRDEVSKSCDEMLILCNKAGMLSEALPVIQPITTKLQVPEGAKQ